MSGAKASASLHFYKRHHLPKKTATTLLLTERSPSNRLRGIDTSRKNHPIAEQLGIRNRIATLCEQGDLCAELLSYPLKLLEVVRLR